MSISGRAGGDKRFQFGIKYVAEPGFDVYNSASG